LLRTTSFCGGMFARTIDQYPAHCLRGDRKEVCSILPARIVLIDQLEVRFVNQRRGLQRVAWPLAIEKVVRQIARFYVDQRYERLQCLLIAIAPFKEQSGYVI